MCCWITGFFVVWGAVIILMAIREPLFDEDEAKEVVTLWMADRRLAAHRGDVQLLLPLVSCGLSYRERYQPD
jgi:hypothetical protein